MTKGKIEPWKDPVERMGMAIQAGKAAAPIRTFDSGATRNNDKDRLDYEGFLSPMVLERYAQYMHKHRLQSDGTLRNSDNWQGLFGDDHYSVCMKSLLRHVMDVWAGHRGCEDVDMEDSICAAMFNLQAYLFKLLKEKENGRTI